MGSINELDGECVVDEDFSWAPKSRDGDVLGRSTFVLFELFDMMLLSILMQWLRRYLYCNMAHMTHMTHCNPLRFEVFGEDAHHMSSLSSLRTTRQGMSASNSMYETEWRRVESKGGGAPRHQKSYLKSTKSGHVDFYHPNIILLQQRELR